MKSDTPTRSICRFISILKVINLHGPISLLGIAKQLDIPYPTISRVIQTLLGSDLIERVPETKCYRVTATVMQLSNGFLGPDRLVVAARGAIADFTQQVGWPVAVTTRIGSSMVVRDSTHHLTSLSFSRCPSGTSLPLLESAAGHVYLAFASDIERDCILAGLQAIGRRSPMLAMFRAGGPITRIREDGHATYERSPHSLNPGKTSEISVPILDGERLAGTLSLELFASAMPVAEAVRRYLPAMHRCAAEVGASLEQPLASWGPPAPQTAAVLPRLVPLGRSASAVRDVPLPTPRQAGVVEHALSVG